MWVHLIDTWLDFHINEDLIMNGQNIWGKRGEEEVEEGEEKEVLKLASSSASGIVVISCSKRQSRILYSTLDNLHTN